MDSFGANPTTNLVIEGQAVGELGRHVEVLGLVLPTHLKPMTNKDNIRESRVGTNQPNPKNPYMKKKKTEMGVLGVSLFCDFSL